ncbi:MAG: hypothetical protein JXR03_18025 [Cyclobacteriaceae bacterium]
MNSTKAILLIPAVALCLLVQAQPNATDLIKKMEETLGGWDKLWEQKDVQFDYDYTYPGKGVSDVSQERYIFEGEHSWAKYTKHQINVFPEKEGDVVQSLVANKPACTLAGEAMLDQKVVGTSAFLRKANYFWFTMMYKLNNPGTVHEYIGEETISGTSYHKVKVSFEAEKTGKEQNDAYMLYINQDTNLVDLFYFSLPAMGVNDIALKMEVNYEEINELLLPTKRSVYMPGEDGTFSNEPSLIQTSTNVKFNNGFTPEDLKI